MAPKGRPLRVLAALRLSQDKEESTSTERQWDIITSWTQANGHVTAGRAEDLDVSGGMDPFKRPELGPWLATPERFDVIAVWKLDRLTRRARHFAELLDWCEKHGKTIVSVTEGFDLSTSMGKMFARIIAAFAEGELDTITERVRGSHAKLRALGRYAGANLPFGYIPVDLPGGGKRLAPDPEYAPILRGMVKDTINGDSTAAIARRLNEKGIMTWGDARKTRRGEEIESPQRWTAATVLQILQNPAVAGYRTQKAEGKKYPRMVLDMDGSPVMATDDPVVTATDWQKAVKAIQSRRTDNGNTPRMPRSESLLQGVIVCGSCKHNLYVHRVTKTVRGEKKLYQSYACHSATKQRECDHPVRVDVKYADAEVEKVMLTLGRQKEITREEYDPGEDYSAQIEEAQSILDELEDDYLAGKYKGEEAKARYERMHAKQTARIDGLRALPQRPASTTIVGTGETYADVWERSSILDRRDFLIAQKVFVEAKAAGTGKELAADADGSPLRDADGRLTWVPTTRPTVHVLPTKGTDIRR